MLTFILHLLFHFLSTITFWGNCLLFLYYRTLRMWFSSNEALTQVSYRARLSPVFLSLYPLIFPLDTSYLPLLWTIHSHWEELYNIERRFFCAIYLSFATAVGTPNHALLENTCIQEWEGYQCWHADPRGPFSEAGCKWFFEDALRWCQTFHSVPAT